MTVLRTGGAPLPRVRVEVSVTVVERGKVGQGGMIVIVVVMGGRVTLTHSVNQEVMVSGVHSPSESPAAQNRERERANRANSERDFIGMTVKVIVSWRPYGELNKYACAHVPENEGAL